MTSAPDLNGLNLRAAIGGWRDLLSSRDFRRQLWTARAGLDFPARRGTRGGDVWAVAMVKNEADILPRTVRQLLAQEVDRVLIVDNGSTDGTVDLLKDLAREDSRVLVGTDREPRYFQSAKMTLLSNWAWQQGAKWVIPFDADEFWFAESGSLGSALRRSRAGVARATVYDAVPADEVFLASTKPSEMVKVAFRAHPLAIVGMGNHWVTRPGVHEESLRILHVPYRTFEQFRHKVQGGAQALAGTGLPQAFGWHWRELGALSSEDLERVWTQKQQGVSSEAGGGQRVLDIRGVADWRSLG